MKIIITLLLGFFHLVATLSAQSFNIEQIPSEEALDNPTSVGRGLSMTLDNAGSPIMATYNNEGKLIFIEKDGPDWNFTPITDDIVDGLISDIYETSIIIFENQALIFYYDGVNGNLMLAKQNAGNWSSTLVDEGAGDDKDTGGYVEARLLENGEIRICYTDNAEDNLMVANGNPEDGFTTSIIDPDGGTWCSFLSDTEILYSQSDNILKATYADNSWSSQDTNIDGVQPSGGYDSDGDLQYYVTQVKSHYGNNGNSDLPLIGFYRANGTAGSSFNDDPGAYPIFVPDVGNVFRTLKYSALFGNSATVYANIIKPDGTYRYPINTFGSCLEEIRDLQLARSNGLVHVSFSYFCSTDSKQVIQYATLQLEENEEEDDEEESNDDSDDDSDNNSDNDGEDGSNNDDNFDDNEDDNSSDDENPDDDSGDSDDENPTLDEVDDLLKNWKNTQNKEELLNSINSTLQGIVINKKVQRKRQKKASKLLASIQKFYSKSPTKKSKQRKLNRKISRFLKKLSKAIKKLKKVL